MCPVPRRMANGKSAPERHEALLNDEDEIAATGLRGLATLASCAGSAIESSSRVLTTGTPSAMGVAPEVAAAAWLDHLEKGGAVPDRTTLSGLLRALLEARVIRPISSASKDVRLVQLDTGKKFPHMLDTANGTLSADEAIWTQCKTKMTHIAVRLCNVQGEPVAGSTVQEGGLELKLTLHKIGETPEPLTDEHNPRAAEGLFRGRASGAFEPTIRLMESRHEFRFQVMLLSSDIVRRAATRPGGAVDLALLQPPPPPHPGWRLFLRCT